MVSLAVLLGRLNTRVTCDQQHASNQIYYWCMMLYIWTCTRHANVAYALPRNERSTLLARPSKFRAGLSFASASWATSSPWHFAMSYLGIFFNPDDSPLMRHTCIATTIISSMNTAIMLPCPRHNSEDFLVQLGAGLLCFFNVLGMATPPGRWREFCFRLSLISNSACMTPVVAVWCFGNGRLCAAIYLDSLYQGIYSCAVLEDPIICTGLHLFVMVAAIVVGFVLRSRRTPDECELQSDVFAFWPDGCLVIFGLLFHAILLHMWLRKPGDEEENPAHGGRFHRFRHCLPLWQQVASPAKTTG